MSNDRSDDEQTRTQEDQYQDEYGYDEDDYEYDPYEDDQEPQRGGRRGGQGGGQRRGGQGGGQRRGGQGGGQSRGGQGGGRQQRGGGRQQRGGGGRQQRGRGGRRGAPAQGGPWGYTSLGPDANVLGALAYVFGLVSGLVVLLGENDNQWARWHGAQSILLAVTLGIGTFLINMIATFVFFGLIFSNPYGGYGFLGSMISMVLNLLWLAAFAIVVFVAYKAYQGEQFRVPVIANFADSMVEDSQNW